MFVCVVHVRVFSTCSRVLYMFVRLVHLSVYILIKLYREAYYDYLKVLLDEMRTRCSTNIHRALYYLCKTELHITLDIDVA